MTQKIGIISDTHGLLRQEVLEKLWECDIILHGGDINKQGISFAVMTVDGRTYQVEKIMVTP